MTKKQFRKQKTPTRQNLGLRATTEEVAQLRARAQAEGKTVQGLFNQFLKVTLDGQPDLFTRFVQGMPASAVVKDKSLKIVWVNEGYTALAGPREAVLGKTIREVWASEESAREIEKRDAKIFELKHATISVETVYDRFGNALQRLRFRFPIRGATGDVEFLGAIGFDIDEIVSREPERIKAALDRVKVRDPINRRL